MNTIKKDIIKEMIRTWSCGSICDYKMCVKVAVSFFLLFFSLSSMELVFAQEKSKKCEYNILSRSEDYFRRGELVKFFQEKLSDRGHYNFNENSNQIFEVSVIRDEFCMSVIVQKNFQIGDEEKYSVRTKCAISEQELEMNAIYYAYNLLTMTVQDFPICN